MSMHLPRQCSLPELRRHFWSRSFLIFLLIGGIILAPIVATLVQMAISRTREYGADAGGAEISGNPMALARALQRIEGYATNGPELPAAPGTQHMYIINPLAGHQGGGLLSLMSTHPPTAERVRRLEAMAHGA